MEHSLSLRAMVPAFLAFILVCVSAGQLNATGLSYTPNIACLATILVSTYNPQLWPRGYAFFLGLLQDVLFATPLGSQALLVLLLAQMMRMRSYNQPARPLRVQWVEAAAMIFAWHGLLWLVLEMVQPNRVPLAGILSSAVANLFWYVPIYYLFIRLLQGRRASTA